MSSLFKTPKYDVHPQQTIEPVSKVRDVATEEQKRARRRLQETSGRRSTMMAGIQNALKRRLGE